MLRSLVPPRREGEVEKVYAAFAAVRGRGAEPRCERPPVAAALQIARKPVVPARHGPELSPGTQRNRPARVEWSLGPAPSLKIPHEVRGAPAQAGAPAHPYQQPATLTVARQRLSGAEQGACPSPIQRQSAVVPRSLLAGPRLKIGHLSRRWAKSRSSPPLRGSGRNQRSATVTVVFVTAL